MTELSEALKVNEAAISSDQTEYQNMMKNSFDGMLERLSAFFGEQNVSFLSFKFKILKIFQFIVQPNAMLNGEYASNFSRNGTPRSSMHILDTIGGVNP